MLQASWTWCHVHLIHDDVSARVERASGQDGGTNLGRLDGVGEADPIDGGAKLAFMYGERNAQRGPSQHKQSNLLSAMIGRASNDEHRIIDVDLKSLCVLDGGSRRQNGKGTPTDEAENNRPR